MSAGIKQAAAANLQMDGRLIISGEVVIDGARHLVEDRYVKCDRSLNHRSWNTTEETSRCPKCFPSELSYHQTNKDEMNFFQQLTEISPNLDLTLRFMRKGDQITVSVLPTTAEEIVPLIVSGTIPELDGGFMDAIRRPMAVANGLATNAQEFEAAVSKGLDKAAAPAEKPAQSAAKPAAAAKTAKPAVKKEDKPAEPAPAAAQQIAPPAEPVTCPWPVDTKLTVTAPGRLRLKEGFLYSDKANEKGEVEVAFGHGHEWVPIQDMEPAKAETAQEAPKAAPPARPAPPKPAPPKP